MTARAPRTRSLEELPGSRRAEGWGRSPGRASAPHNVVPGKLRAPANGPAANGSHSRGQGRKRRSFENASPGRFGPLPPQACARRGAARSAAKVGTFARRVVARKRGPSGDAPRTRSLEEWCGQGRTRPHSMSADRVALRPLRPKLAPAGSGRTAKTRTRPVATRVWSAPRSHPRKRGPCSALHRPQHSRRRTRHNPIICCLYRGTGRFGPMAPP